MKKVGMLLAALLVVGSVDAQPLKTHLTADTLSGYREGSPGGPISSAATGTFELTINDAAQEIHYTLTYSGLEASVTQSHIHFGQRSVNGGISVWLCETAASPRPVGSPDVPDCPQSGTVESTFGANHVIGPAGQGIAAGEFEELVAALRAGVAYVNVHSSKFPGGEIRGQINDSDQRDN